MMRRTLVAVGVAMSIVASASGHAGVPGMQSTMPWQMTQNLEQLIQSGLLGDQLQQAFAAYQEQMRQGGIADKNILKLPGDVWANVTGDIAKLQQLAQHVQSIGFTAGSIEKQWQQMYQGYKPTVDFYKDYGQLQQDTTLKVKRAMNAADISIDDVANLDKTMDLLRRRSQDAQGQLQAIQAGNAISLAVVDQIARMRVLMRTQIDMQQAYLQRQVELEDKNMGSRKQQNQLDVNKMRSR